MKSFCPQTLLAVVIRQAVRMKLNQIQRAPTAGINRNSLENKKPGITPLISRQLPIRIPNVEQWIKQWLQPACKSTFKNCRVVFESGKVCARKSGRGVRLEDWAVPPHLRFEFLVWGVAAINDVAIWAPAADDGGTRGSVHGLAVEPTGTLPSSPPRTRAGWLQTKGHHGQ